MSEKKSQPLRTTSIGFPEMRHKSQKEEAFAQLKKHNVPERLEEVLNKACRVKPSDLFGYMSDYFNSLSKEPVISSLGVFEGLDTSGGRSVEVDLYCTVCGKEKLVGEASISLDPLVTLPESITSSLATGIPRKGSGKKKPISRGGSPSSNARVTESKDHHPAGEVNRRMDFVETVKTEISKALVGLHVGKQCEIDQVLEDLRLKAESEKLILHPSSLLAVSCAVARAGSHLTSSHPLFLYLSSTRTHFQPALPPSPLQMGPCSLIVDLCGGKENGVQHLELALQPEEEHSSRRGSLSGPQFPPVLQPQKYSVPIPVVAALGAGSGKLKVREFCLCPLPGTGASLSQQMRMLERVHYELGKHLAVKMGASARVSLPNGAYSPPMDKMDLALDLIKEATVNAGFLLDTDLAIFIDIGATGLYDEDKGKYELMNGHWKNTDELINVLSDLVSSSIGVLGFVDPLHHKDVSGWKKLLERVAGKCVVIADRSLQKGLPLAQPRPNTSRCRRLSVPLSEDSLPKEVGGGEGEGGEAVEDEGVEGLTCAALSWEHTLSSTMDKADQLKGCCHCIMMTTPLNLTDNTTIADLAVAAHCRFIRMGAPTGVSTLLLNRLLRVYEELHSRKLYESVHTILFASDVQQ